MSPAQRHIILVYIFLSSIDYPFRRRSENVKPQNFPYLRILLSPITPLSSKPYRPYQTSTMATDKDKSSKIYYTSKFGSIKKLNNSNYAIWKGDVTVILQAMGAYAIVNGEEEEPAAGNTAAARTAIADYQKRRAYAISAIRFSCTDEAAIYVNGLSDPREMWQILKNARPTPGESISVYVSRIQAFQLQLQGSTEEITDQALRTHVYTPTPPEFKTAIGYLKRTDGVTISNLITVLKETEEENKVEAAIVDSKSGTGLYARGRGGRGGRRGRGGRGGRGGKGTKNRSCTYCSKDNHTTEDCWKRQKEQIQQSRKRTREVDDNEVIYYQ
jgi:hypothetical protein